MLICKLIAIAHDVESNPALIRPAKIEQELKYFKTELH